MKPIKYNMILALSKKEIFDPIARTVSHTYRLDYAIRMLKADLKAMPAGSWGVIQTFYDNGSKDYNFAWERDKVDNRVLPRNLW